MKLNQRRFCASIFNPPTLLIKCFRLRLSFVIKLIEKIKVLNGNLSP